MVNNIKQITHCQTSKIFKNPYAHAAADLSETSWRSQAMASFGRSFSIFFDPFNCSVATVTFRHSWISNNGISSSESESDCVTSSSLSYCVFIDLTYFLARTAFSSFLVLLCFSLFEAILSTPPINMVWAFHWLLGNSCLLTVSVMILMKKTRDTKMWYNRNSCSFPNLFDLYTNVFWYFGNTGFFCCWIKLQRFFTCKCNFIVSLYVGSTVWEKLTRAAKHRTIQNFSCCHNLTLRHVLNKTVINAMLNFIILMHGVVSTYWTYYAMVIISL